MNKKDKPELMFSEISHDSLPTILESLCVKCKENGTTTLLLTQIPMFREIIIASFVCDHCGEKNNEVQFAGRLPDFGVEILFRGLHKSDLNREIIKSEHATIEFREIQLQIPSNGRAEINTIEGFLMRAKDQLTHSQSERLLKDPSSHQKIQEYLIKLDRYINGDILPLTIIIIDPSGNSNVKNPYAPLLDKNLEISHFHRTTQQLLKMGYSIENAEIEAKQIHEETKGNKLNFTKPFEEDEFMKHESIAFEVNCEACLMPGKMRMCETSVPYFTDMVIMSFNCDYCGAHSAETKNSGVIGEQCLEITLKVDSEVDLKRDLFKSETCAVNLPEIQLELDYGTLGGVFTTVEGLLEKILDHLGGRNPFADSDEEFGGKMKVVLGKLAAMQAGKQPFTLILIDPLAHSFLQNPYMPSQDKNAKTEFRARTFDENEMLGLNDIKTENYQS